jgi:hypothetical protein
VRMRRASKSELEELEQRIYNKVVDNLHQKWILWINYGDISDICWIRIQEYLWLPCLLIS